MDYLRPEGNNSSNNNHEGTGNFKSHILPEEGSRLDQSFNDVASHYTAYMKEK